MSTTPSAETPGAAPDGSGVLLLDKPQGWTSHQVVGRVRRLLGTRKVGHAGTLDPMATGLLIIGVNRATRLLGELSGASKCYSATIRLGQASSTDDAEGGLTVPTDTSAITHDQVLAGIAALTGPIQQVPSSVSAIKVDGRRAYARVREGEQVELAARPVTIERFEVLHQESADVDGTTVLDLQVEVACSSGTYIRALARDLGDDLRVGGHLTALRRTSIGGFTLPSTPVDLDALDLHGQDPSTPDPASLGRLLTMAEVAERTFVCTRIDPDQARRLVHGQRVVHAADPDLLERAAGGAPVAVLCGDELVALAQVRPATGADQSPQPGAVVLHPGTVLAHDLFA